MNEIEKDNIVGSLFAVLPLFQKLILNSLDMKNLKLTRKQLFILLALMRKERLNMSQIAKYLASSHEQATRSVAPLVEAGLLERFYDESNRKLVLIRLTDAGHEFIRVQKELLKENLIKHFDALSEQDVQRLINSLSVTIQILEKVEGQYSQ